VVCLSSPVRSVVFPNWWMTGRTGFLVPPKNAAALADALQRLSEDEALRRQFGRAGRAKVVRDFNLKISTARRANLFLGDTAEAPYAATHSITPNLKSQYSTPYKRN